jgi:hypothetical protein
MAVMMKIIIYGRFESGKYALALHLVQDNPMLARTVVISDAGGMRRFLASPDSSVGIVYAESVRSIMSNYKQSKFGSVLFIAAPGEMDAAENSTPHSQGGTRG